ncbi:MAG TPA: ATP-binding cassette domain-containing protein [Streptosporangiaceae bacterium]|nr:ATP-binding cassette domain-containing protein [Streptosporangiaceae bacterium]
MLEITELVKRYGDVQALDGCSLQVPPGRLVGLLGPNGAGKTTVMRTLFGLVVPDAGAVRWRGRPVDARAWRRFGYMPEERGLYPAMRVAEQIAYFGQLSGLTARDAVAAARRWMDRLGLAGRAGSRIDRLSHGNRQRVQLAVALVHDPDLLVLDEPFAGLDPIAVDALAALMHELCEAGTTVLFSSHQLDLVEHLCEDVVILDQGRVVLAGRLSELRAAAPRRRLEVALAGDAGDRWWERWSPALPGVEVVSGDARRVRLTAGRSADLEKVLIEARSAGEVVRFDFEPPSLSEIFRDAVRR